VFIQWPATACAALAGLSAVWIIALIPGVRYCVSYPFVLLGGIVANLAIAVFRVMETVPEIADFILNKLKKDITLSGRTGLWDSFWQQIDGHMLSGIGTPVEGYAAGAQVYDHLHNVIFDFLAQGGIIALVLFFMMLVVIGIPLTRYAKTPVARIMTATMAAFLLMAIPEVCRHCAIFLIFPLAWHVPKIQKVAQRNIE
jgi:O-antigen ligase